MFVLSLGRAMSGFILGQCEFFNTGISFSSLALKDEGFSVTELWPVCPRKTLVHLRIHCDAKHGVRQRISELDVIELSNKKTIEIAFEVFVCFGYPNIGWRLCTSGSPLDA